MLVAPRQVEVAGIAVIARNALVHLKMTGLRQRSGGKYRRAQLVPRGAHMLPVRRCSGRGPLDLVSCLKQLGMQQLSAKIGWNLLHFNCVVTCPVRPSSEGGGGGRIKAESRVGLRGSRSQRPARPIHGRRHAGPPRQSEETGSLSASRACSGMQLACLNRRYRAVFLNRSLRSFKVSWHPLFAVTLV